MARPKRKKVLVAMSGGVDSSVAAALLLREGYEVVGCFMRLGSPGEALDVLQADDEAGDGRGEGDVPAESRRIRIGHQGCCSINDAADARHCPAAPWAPAMSRAKSCSLMTGTPRARAFSALEPGFSPART